MESSTSRWLVPAHFILSELVQADVSYYLSANVSHSSIRGSVWMFDNDGIRHSVEME